jgi:hypothetical protein
MKKPTIDAVAALSNKGLGYRKIADQLNLSERKVRDMLLEVKKRHLVEETMAFMGDPHADPKEPNDRFSWAGNFLADRQPKRLICTGDFADMDSLNSFEKGKKSMEGKRYRLDVDAVLDAQEQLLTPIEDLDIELHMIGGNHEHRILRACNELAHLDGTISLNDLQFEEFGWNYHKYGKVVTIDGIAFTHHFTSGRMDRPIGGINQAQTILNIKKMSCVQGHSHVLDYKQGTRGNGEPIFALVAGCFFQKEVHYVTQSEQDNWWPGIVMATPYINDSGFKAWDLEFVSLERIKSKYS